MTAPINMRVNSGLLQNGRHQLEALRSARGRQLVARALRPINRRRTRSSPPPRLVQPLESLVSFWRSRAFASTEGIAVRLPEGVVEILGTKFSYPPDWSGTGLVQLRRFHLHYGEEILGCARLGERWLDPARVGIATWIEQNPPARGDGWHPYALSTRVGNWVAAFSLQPSLATAAANESLWHQLSFLERNVEDDILGNHVIRNARGLVLGGLAFREQRFVDRGLALLERELPEQILPDGGHYERSPVYHALVLRDLLEVRAASGASMLDSAINRMTRFSAWLNRPDGRPAMFNDGSLELAPDLSDVLHEPTRDFALFADTGYAVVRNDTFWFAFDCGAASPPFLPPHAHADGLSFQLWVRGQPIVVDPGTFTYERGVDRDWFRATRAHATVSIDGADQFDFVGPFRAIRIPPVQILEASGSAQNGAVAAQISGFRSIPGGVSHRRRVAWSQDRISIEDRIDGEGRHRIESSLPLAPGVRLNRNLAVPAVGMTIEPLGAPACTVEERWVSERFFNRAAAPALVAYGNVSLPVTIGWTLRFNEISA